MSDCMKLAKVDLGPDWIDLSLGEPKVVLQACYKQLNRVGSTFKLPCDSKGDILGWEYQPAAGYKPLVDFLEHKYKAKVIVANGAKQGMSACFYALKKLGHDGLAIHKPYWVSTPSMIQDQGLWVEYANKDKDCKANAFMLTCPNNPDGRELTKEEILDLDKEAKSSGLTLLHDAAYYTPVYMKSQPTTFGDVQIYSASKMYGMSGLRIGYVVCHNPKIYSYALEHLEKTTSGASILSQRAILEVERYFASNKASLKEFEKEARDAIAESRKALTEIKPEVLELPADFLSSNSMFAWCKAGPKLDMSKAKVHMLDGSIFGVRGMVRLNIAYPVATIKEAVRRLNDQA